MLPRCPTKSPCQSAVIACHGKNYLTATYFLLAIFSLLFQAVHIVTYRYWKIKNGEKECYFSILKSYYRKTPLEFIWYAFECSRLIYSSYPYYIGKYKSCKVFLDTFLKKAPFTPIKSPYIHAQKKRPTTLAHIYHYTRHIEGSSRPLSITIHAHAHA